MSREMMKSEQVMGSGIREAGAFVAGSSGARLRGRVREGSGPPILLLHGGPGCPDYLGPVAELLAPRHRVITFNQRGVAGSIAVNGRYDIEDYLADIEALRAHLGIGKWHVFGHSWGGLLGQLYASAYPDRLLSLFLCNSALGIGHDWRRTRRAVARHVVESAGVAAALAMGTWYAGTWAPGRTGAFSARRLYRQFWRHSFADPSSATAPDARWIRGVSRDALHGTEQAVLRTAANCLPVVWDAPPWQTCVLYGSNDIFGEDAEVVRRRFPRARLVTLEAAHLPWLQAPAAFRRVLDDFYGSMEKNGEAWATGGPEERRP